MLALALAVSLGATPLDLEASLTSLLARWPGLVEYDVKPTDRP